MRYSDFKASLAAADSPPAALSAELRALWHDAKGDWEAAHKWVMHSESRAAAWVHAYLHRKEGDLANASYWYARALQPVVEAPLEEEWEQIARALCELVEEL
ncbi:hypothetical protein AXK12_06040 [Cephaloticoccus capnophilus]|uniref:Uncharacterized protein n=1 Tax=Cephaloticoccus capnophilus TaxID=1548208 RepID=A0A139SL55_9BACT|nr:hypothetical protein [Cephaloticoccus capnophilus]KXU35257.1 hypothetical protein AXK12_06040 [Cephaloticoccus capnophilus]